MTTGETQDVFFIEYEVPPLRAIYFVSIAADNEDTARQAFAQQCERGRIRKIRIEDDVELPVVDPESYM
jgi:hypothetical protein